MATVAKKENMTIAIREYTDSQGQSKKVWKTIGELITWDDGKQSFELWGPTGSTRGSVFEQEGRGQQSQPAPHGYQQAPAPQQPANQFGNPSGQPAPSPQMQGGIYTDDVDSDIPF